MPGRYWRERQLIFTVQGPQGEFLVTVDQPFARIGSHPDSDVLLPGGGIPLRCFYLHAGPYGLDWVRLWDTDDPQAAKRGRLHHGEPLVFGLYRMHILVTGEETKDGLLVPVVNRPVPKPFPQLLIATHHREIGRRELHHRLTVIGRKGPSSIRISSERISSTHCVLAWDDQTLWAVDLLSGNGTWLQGERVQAAELTPGAHLQVGDLELTYLVESPSVATAPVQATPIPANQTPLPEVAPHDSRGAYQEPVSSVIILRGEIDKPLSVAPAVLLPIAPQPPFQDIPPAPNDSPPPSANEPAMAQFAQQPDPIVPQSAPAAPRVDPVVPRPAALAPTNNALALRPGPAAPRIDPIAPNGDAQIVVSRVPAPRADLMAEAAPAFEPPTREIPSPFFPGAKRDGAPHEAAPPARAAVPPPRHPIESPSTALAPPAVPQDDLYLKMQSRLMRRSAEQPRNPIWTFMAMASPVILIAALGIYWATRSATTPADTIDTGPAFTPMKDLINRPGGAEDEDEDDDETPPPTRSNGDDDFEMPEIEDDPTPDPNRDPTSPGF